MCHHENRFYRGTREGGCCCHHRPGNAFLSKKMQVQALKKQLAAWEEQVADIKAYIQELEAGNN